MQRVVAAHRERYGRLDVLVNSADVGEAVRYLLRTSPACVIAEIVFQRPGETL